MSAKTEHFDRINRQEMSNISLITHVAVNSNSNNQFDGERRGSGLSVVAAPRLQSKRGWQFFPLLNSTVASFKWSSSGVHNAAYIKMTIPAFQLAIFNRGSFIDGEKPVTKGRLSLNTLIVNRQMFADCSAPEQWLCDL